MASIRRIAALLGLIFAAPVFAAPLGISSKSPLRQHVCTYTFSTTATITDAYVPCILPQAGMVLKDVQIAQTDAGAGGTSWTVMVKRATADLLSTAGGFTRAAGAAKVTNALTSPMQVFSNPTGGTRPVIKRNAAATQTITVGAGLANDEKVTIGGIDFVAKTSGAVGWQFNIGTDENSDATALAALINSHPNVAVTATASGAVVTITAKRSGTAGNAITLTETGSGFTVGGATLAGGYDYASAGASLITATVTLSGSYSGAVAGIVTLYFEPEQ